MGTDKALHFGACAFTSGLVAVIMAALGVGCIGCMAAALMAGIAAGLGKEYGDYASPSNHWDWGDVLADLIGAAAGSLFGLIALLL